MQRQLSTPPDRRSLALFTVPLAPTPMPPFTPTPSPPHFLLLHRRRQSCFFAFSFFLFLGGHHRRAPLSPTTPLPLLALCSPLRRQGRSPMSIRRLPSSFLRASCGFLRGAAGRRNVCSTPQFLFTLLAVQPPRQCVLRASADRLVAAERSAGVNAHG